MTLDKLIEELINFKLKNQLTGEEQVCRLYNNLNLITYEPIQKSDLQYIKKEDIETDDYLDDKLTGHDLIVL